MAETKQGVVDVPRDYGLLTFLALNLAGVSYDVNTATSRASSRLTDPNILS